MDRPTRQAAATLRKKFRYFLADSSPQKRARKKVVERLGSLQWDACVFGGTLRDIAIAGPYSPVRDIDIVVSSVDAEEIGREMREWVVRRNQFGGLRLNVDGTLFDMWSLQDTWAFRHWGLPDGTGLFTTFEQLPLTTFLTVESIVILLRPEPLAGRTVYEHGFFESLNTRVVELNRAENPYPALCIARALITANRLGFGLGTRLIKYLANAFAQTKCLDIVEAQQKHYGRVVLSGDTLGKYQIAIEAAVKRGDCEPLDLRVEPQLAWDWAQPESAEQILAEEYR
jgi:hypothetical protein